MTLFSRCWSASVAAGELRGLWDLATLEISLTFKSR